MLLLLLIHKKTLNIPKGLSIRSYISRDRQDHSLLEKEQTIIYKTYTGKRTIKQNKPSKTQGMNSSSPEGKVLPASLVAPVMLLLLQAR
jgi:hypothetical protein